MSSAEHSSDISDCLLITMANNHTHSTNTKRVTTYHQIMNNVPVENVTSSQEIPPNPIATHSNHLNQMNESSCEAKSSQHSDQNSVVINRPPLNEFNGGPQATDFLSQLSEVAAKRLDEDLKNNRCNISSDIGASKKSDTSSFEPLIQPPKRRSHNMAEDMFGNCLHSSESKEPNDPGSTRKKASKVKRDRSHLRKGKWTPEEEEYTSRIIQHFRSGLLTLPEGTTLRSYIAQKLACDPMRITKKFAGASCLGKRVYHLHERSQFTIHDVDMAKAELNELERRFRLRVEEGNCHQALSSHTSNSILNSANQSSFTSTPNIFGFPYIHQHLNLSPIDPTWLARYASTLGASALSAPGLSAFILQLIASQQMQQANTIAQQQPQQQQQPLQQLPNEMKQSSLQQFQVKQLQPQIQVQQGQQPTLQSSEQQAQVQQTQQSNNQIKQPEKTLSNLPLHLNQNNNHNLPMMVLQSSVNPDILSNLLMKQVGTNNTNKLPVLPLQQETFSHVDHKTDNQHQVSVESLAAIRQTPTEFHHLPQLKTHLEGQKISTTQSTKTEPSQHISSPKLEKKKHSKEDVDAGNTLIDFIQELRKNHDKVMSMPINGTNVGEQKIPPNNSVNENATLNSISNSSTNGGSMSVSTVGLVSETPRNLGHLKHDFNDASSSLSGDTRSLSVNKDESTKSDSSNESGYLDVSSEDDQNVFIKPGPTGPIRKRFRRHEFSEANVQRHEKKTRNN